MHYHSYELAHVLLAPLRSHGRLLQQTYVNPCNPISYTSLGKAVAASCEVFDSMTRRYGKPAWRIDHTVIAGQTVPVRQMVATSTAFCDLVRFARDETVCGRRRDPKVLLVAPMSGHHATLLRGTVEAMIGEHDLYVTDWRDARKVPLRAGRFDLEGFIDHVIGFIRFLGPDTHVMAVCQPSVPVLAAAAIMAAQDDPCRPASITLMGGPIDTRRNPTVVNELAQSKSIDWFESRVISRVPWPHPGYMRRVYPGFVQLTGFMTMNLERHMEAHVNLFDHLIRGDGDSVQEHHEFYQEYLAVMDLPAEFYLQTVRSVFQDHALPNGALTHRGQKVDCRAIRDIALMTVEGERDDICGLGQTEAAHDLCSGLPADLHWHHMQPRVGHYGVFNGKRWRTEIQPRVAEMIRTVEAGRRGGERPAATA